jgi:hypothetical protein
MASSNVRGPFLFLGISVYANDMDIYLALSA